MSSAVLPYTVKPHPVTALYSGKFGMWLFLASEVMLFGAFFSTYVLLRVGAPEGTWPQGQAETFLNVPIGMTNTLILILSSITMVMAWAALKMKNLGQARGWLAATVFLACSFLAIKLTLEYNPKLHHYGVWLEDGSKITGHIESEAEDRIVFAPDPHGDDEGDEHAQSMRIDRADIQRIANFGPQHSTFFAIYWTMTGLHGLHVFGGIVVITYLLLPGCALWKTDPEWFTNRVECTGLYWHFVDLVWIFLFPTLYLL